MTFRTEEYCLENEIWKPIPFYEELYEASNLGRIRSHHGKLTYTKRHGVRKWKGRILKNKTKVVNIKTGYRVDLWIDGKSKGWLVARLVCLAFYGIPDNFSLTKTGSRMTVNHKDGNRLNNKVENLEWITLKENIQHAFRTGLNTTGHKVALIDENNIYKEFNSNTKANTYIGRSHDYITNCKKHNRKIISIDGNIYTAKVIL